MSKNLKFSDAMDMLKIFNETIAFNTFKNNTKCQQSLIGKEDNFLILYIEINNKIINYCKSLHNIMRDQHAQRKLDKFIEYIKEQNELYIKILKLLNESEQSERN